MKCKVQSVKCKIKILSFKFLIAVLTFTFLLLTFPNPAYAEVNIGDKFGFREIKSLGEGTSRLVAPAFQLTAAAVVIYFLLGAFKYLKAGGNKEELEGARQMIVHAIIGFIILMFAFLVLQFLLNSLFKITDLKIIGP